MSEVAEQPKKMIPLVSIPVPLPEETSTLPTPLDESVRMDVQDVPSAQADASPVLTILAETRMDRLSLETPEVPVEPSSTEQLKQTLELFMSTQTKKGLEALA